MKKLFKNHKFLPIVLFAGSLILLVVLFYWRYKIGLIRYFDSDEFMYPNWAYHTMTGSRPYLDFMLFFTPLFVLFNIPIFWFFHGSEPMTIGRIIMFVLTILNSASLVWLFWEARKSWIAIMAAVIFVVLPMPFAEKLLEIRPENLALLFLTLGLIFQLRFFNKKRNKSIILSGLFYSLALLTLQKILPYVIIALAIMFFSALAKQKTKTQSQFRPFIFQILGFTVPILVFLLWAFFSGNPRLVIYSVTRFPLEMARGMGSSNAVDTMFYFQPNINYFGEWGKSTGYTVNTVLWITGLLVGCTRFLSCFKRSTKNKLQELLLSLIFFGAILTYIYFTSLKYPQYLMPAAIFIVFYCTDALYLLWKILNRKILPRVIFAIFFVSCGFLLYRTSMIVMLPKFEWHNKIYYAWMDKIFATVPKSEYLFDLTGITLYYPYPYYMCCMAIGNFQSFVSYPLPSISEALEKTKTRYIYAPAIGLTNAVSPKDKEFIEKNYILNSSGLILESKNW